MDNPNESAFCKNCGKALSSTTANKPISSLTSPDYQEVPQAKHMEDLLFVSKKKKSNLGVLLLILFLIGGGFVFLIFLVWVGSDDSSTTDYTTPTTTTTTTTTDNSSVFPLGYLELTKIDSEWVGGAFYIKGTIKNKNTELAKNVNIRVDFSTDEAGTDAFDTRYFKVIGVPATGAHSFRERIYINDPGGDFWYQAAIQSAEK